MQQNYTFRPRPFHCLHSMIATKLHLPRPFYFLHSMSATKLHLPSPFYFLHSMSATKLHLPMPFYFLHSILPAPRGFPNPVCGRRLASENWVASYRVTIACNNMMTCNIMLYSRTDRKPPNFGFKTMVTVSFKTHTHQNQCLCVGVIQLKVLMYTNCFTQ